MGILSGIVGAALVLAAVVDIIWTTLVPAGGAGPVTARVADVIWKMLLRRHRRRPNHRMLTHAGIAILLITIAVWLLALWAGWTLIFNADRAAVVTSSTGRPADLVDRIYFAGFTMFTLGIGDYVPGQGVWQVLTILCVMNSLVLVTLTVTYLVPLLSGVTEKRQIAAYINTLGETPGGIAATGAGDSDWQSMGQHFVALTPMLLASARKYLAYPLLHYFHPPDQRLALPVAIARLDEALTLIRFGLRPLEQPDMAFIEPLRRAIRVYLDTMGSDFIEPADEAPAPVPLEVPGLDAFQTVETEQFHAALETLTQRRRLLAGMVRHDGWDWQDVTSSER